MLSSVLKSERAIVVNTLFDAIRQLMAPPEKSQRSIGFRVEEGRPAYRRLRRTGREKGK